MSQAASKLVLRSDLRAMLIDGFAFSVMVGIGESFVAPFALALGHGPITAALVTTVPLLSGAFLQLATPAAVGFLRSHKRWVVLCASLQAATFVPLLAGALAGEMSAPALFLTTTLYWGLGMATSPAWNTWAGTLVPAPIRPAFFARRSRWSQVALFAGFVTGSTLLQLGEGDPLQAFVAVFAIALVARLDG